ADILKRVRAVAPHAGILVVDDSSPDGTADIVRAMAPEVGEVEILSRPRKSGLGSAYRDGFKWGRQRGFDVLMEMDSDFSHDPADIPRLLKGIDDGADLVIGSRYVPGGQIPHWPWHRRALSKYGNRYSSAMLRLDVRDLTAGYRAYRGEIVARSDAVVTTAGQIAHGAARRPHQLVGRDREVGVRRARRRPELLVAEQVLVDEHAQRLAVAERRHTPDREPGGIAHGVGVL